MEAHRREAIRVAAITPTAPAAVAPPHLPPPQHVAIPDVAQPLLLQLPPQHATMARPPLPEARQMFPVRRDIRVRQRLPKHVQTNTQHLAARRKAIAQQPEETAPFPVAVTHLIVEAPAEILPHLSATLQHHLATAVLRRTAAAHPAAAARLAAAAVLRHRTVVARPLRAAARPAVAAALRRRIVAARPATAAPLRAAEAAVCRTHRAAATVAAEQAEEAVRDMADADNK